MGIGKQAGAAALQGAVIGAGMTVAQKVWNGEEIDGQEVVEAALTGGADFGVKAATAGALKVASEKEILSVIPKYARRHFCKYRIRCGGKCKGAGQGCHWGAYPPGGF